MKATLTPPPPSVPLRSRVGFVLHALLVLGGLSTITALIERAAP
ncbi:hypothetical protein [Pseudorhodoferax sp.]